MFDVNNMLHILTILESIEKIELYTSSFTGSNEFYKANDQLNFNATINLLIAIGEENKKIDNELKSSEMINWKSISAMRDKLSHNYRGIDESIVWDIIKNYLPQLKIALIELIPQVKESKKYIQVALKSGFYAHLKFLLKVT